MQTTIRFTTFLAGLIGLHLGERRFPHHRPKPARLRRWVSNLGLGAISGVVVSLACAVCLAYRPPDSRLFGAGVGALPFAVRIVGELLLLDAITYFLHRAYHEVPILWRLHLVHHADEDLDVSSASRFHPGEVLLSALVKVGVVFLLGVSAIGLIVFETVMLVCAQFQHSNIRIGHGVERWLWRFVVPPAMHRLHHSPAIADTNSNYGTILTLWDRLFRTLNRRRRDVSEAFGIAGVPDAPGLWRLVLLPFRRVSASTPTT